MSRERKLSRSVGLLLVLACLWACTSGTSAPRVLSPSSTGSATAIPSGVPAAVYRAARSALDAPGNKITQPVQWIRTTFGAYERVVNPGSYGPAATAKADVYVVQLRGDFLFTGSGGVLSASASPRPRRLPVVGMIIPVGKFVPGAAGGYEAEQPVDLAAIAPVHFFTMP